jgi:hypothetical protein
MLQRKVETIVRDPEAPRGFGSQEVTTPQAVVARGLKMYSVMDIEKEAR